MDPGHHTAFLLAILICILLLFLVVSAFFMCYWRGNCFKVKNRESSMRLQGLMKNQATSMTSVILTLNDPRPLCNGPRTYPTFHSLPITVGQKGTITSSFMSLDRHTLSRSEEDGCSQTGNTSELIDTSAWKTSDTTECMSTLHYVLSSGASLLDSVLDKSSMFNLKAKRRSSSMKSGVDSDILLVSMESQVPVNSGNGPFRAASLPRELSQCTVLCEDSNEQFTWNTDGLSGLDSSAHTESLSVPGTLERESHISVERDSCRQNLVQLRKPVALQSKAWFVPLGNRPLSEEVVFGQQELNNVTSLDSGVDIIEVQVRQECDGLSKNNGSKSTWPSLMDGHITFKTYKEQQDEDARKGQIHRTDQPHEENQELQISHQEAARKLNKEHYGRTLWQKREDRPLIGIS